MEQLVRASDGRVVIASVRRATGWRTRLRGLLGTGSLPEGEALLLEPAKQIHTIGMRFPIDVVFCDGRLHVIDVVRSLRAGRVTRPVARARYVFELADGAARLIERGDVLQLITGTGDSSDRNRGAEFRDAF